MSAQLHTTGPWALSLDTIEIVPGTGILVIDPGVKSGNPVLQQIALLTSHLIGGLN